MKSLFFFFLSITSAFAADGNLQESICGHASALKPTYARPPQCTDALPCGQVYRTIAEQAARYERAVTEACRGLQSLGTEAISVSGFGNSVQVLQRGIADTTRLIQVTREAQTAVRERVQKGVEDQNQRYRFMDGTPSSSNRNFQAHKALLLRIISSGGIRSNGALSGTPVTEQEAIDINKLSAPATESVPSMQALARGVQFIRTAESLISQREETKQSLQSSLTQSQGRAQEMGQQPEPTPANQNPAQAANPPGGGSAVDPNTLLTVGAGLAPLAMAMMQKKPQSGVSGPTDPVAPAATPPLGSSQLGAGKTAIDGRSTVGDLASPKTEEEKKSEEALDSGVFSPFTAIPETSSSLGSGSKITKGEAMAPVGGGSASSSSSRESSKAEDRPLASAAKPAEDASLTPFSGALNLGSSSSSSSLFGNDVDPMKDMIKDLETATGLDNGAPLDMPFTGDPNVQAGVSPADSEGLFPRIHAALLRSQKKGLVLGETQKLQ